jgi:hypothetical protein
MRTARLSVAIFFIAALSNSLHAYAGSTDENGDQGPKTEPVTKPDPECDHNDVLPSHSLFRLTL